MNNVKFSYKAIKDCIFLGVKYKYESYDHQKAILEFNDHLHKIGKLRVDENLIDSNEFIPDNIKQNCIVWRIGKIRKIKFNPQGKMWIFYIGNRRAKRFFCDDFGIKVFPIIHKIDDKYNLINQNLAIDIETIL
jgi:hypothetical protein